MGAYTIQLPEGAIWTPRFVHSIDQEKCIGCGRCFRVCGRNVLSLYGMTEDGELVAVDADGYDDDEEFERKVMTIVNKSSCIGCEACSRICPKGCYTHRSAEVQ